MRAGEEPIADDELLYRRVPVSANPKRYDPGANELNDQAFAPYKDDVTGISISRGKYKSVEEAAKGWPGSQYYVAILKAGELQRWGITIEPRPDPPEGYDPAHAELPQLNYADRKESKTLEIQRKLVELCGNNVVGPFPTPAC